MTNAVSHTLSDGHFSADVLGTSTSLSPSTGVLSLLVWVLVLLSVLCLGVFLGHVGAVQRAASGASACMYVCCGDEQKTGAGRSKKVSE